MDAPLEELTFNERTVEREYRRLLNEKTVEIEGVKHTSRLYQVFTVELLEVQFKEAHLSTKEFG